MEPGEAFAGLSIMRNDAFEHPQEHHYVPESTGYQSASFTAVPLAPG